MFLEKKNKNKPNLRQKTVFRPLKFDAITLIRERYTEMQTKLLISILLWLQTK